MLRAEREPVLLFLAMSVVGLAPPLARATDPWTIARVRVNGVPLELRDREIPAARADLAAALLVRWQASGAAAPLAMQREGQTLIGRQRGSLHETITLSDAGRGRTHVLVAVRDLAVPVSTAPRLPLALPVGQRVLQVIEQGSGAGQTRTYILGSTRDASVALSQLQRALGTAGWSSRVARPGGGAGTASALWAERGLERLDAVISAESDGARIVLQVSGHGH